MRRVVLPMSAGVRGCVRGDLLSSYTLILGVAFVVVFFAIGVESFALSVEQEARGLLNDAWSRGSIECRCAGGVLGSEDEVCGDSGTFAGGSASAKATTSVGLDFPSPRL